MNAKGATFKEIRDLVELVAKRGLSVLEVGQAGFRIRIVGSRPAPVIAAAGAIAQELHVVTAPIAGTFFRSPSPQSAPFAETGQRITEGAILCIIQSAGPRSGVMNEIESDVAGELVEAYARSGQAVEYGERLFGIRLAVGGEEATPDLTAGRRLSA